MAKSAKKTIQKTKPKAKASKKIVKKTIKKSAAKKTTKKPKKDLMCFLSSACVDFYGLKDTCYELNTLRNYRDSYLAQTVEGKKLIQRYYRVSPEIVKQINSDTNKFERYSYIYSQIHEACTAIENQKFLKAKNIYKAMVNTLILKYTHV